MLILKITSYNFYRKKVKRYFDSAYLTRSSVEAGLMGAVVYLALAVSAREARGTVARVRALARVEARAVVSARPVVGAVVEVLVAEQSTPALVAQAVPGLLAGAVEAAGVALALVAQRALPSVVTSGNITHCWIRQLYIS